MKRKNWKIWLLAAAVIATVILVAVTGVVPSYSRALKANWGISLPWQARMQEVYKKDSGPSFLGDGVRYHVFSYKYEDFIDLMFAWAFNNVDSLEESADSWLDEIQVPEEERPAYEQCYYWHKAERNNDIIIFWNPEQNLLYVVESFF